MEKEYFGSNLYYAGETPKLACITSVKTETEDALFWDRHIQVLNMNGEKLLDLHDYNYPEYDGAKHSQKVKCYDDFFVVDTSLIERDKNRSVNYYEAYNYDGELLHRGKTAWDEERGFEKVMSIMRISGYESNDQISCGKHERE